MSALTFALGMTLLQFLWQGLLIGVSCALGLSLLRNAPAAYRYLLACGALLACLLWPALELYGRMQGQAAVSIASSMLDLAGHGVGASGVQWNPAGWLRQLVGLWALCAAMLALRMMLGLWWIDRSSRARLPQHRQAQLQWQQRVDQLCGQFGIRRKVQLKLAEDVASPVTAGYWKPVVLLPAALLSGMPPDLVEALLAHELAHIRHHDYLINLLQNLIETLLFYHPAVWWISHRIRIERELMADDFAASKLGEPRRLALALSELEKLQFSTHRMVLAANGGNLMDRIQRLCRPAPRALNWKAAIPMLGVALACLTIYVEATAADQQAQQVTAPKLEARSCKKPVWPEGARARKETGTVTIKFDVDASGKVVGSSIAQSSGSSELDEAARSAMSLCQFQPGTEAGKPVAAVGTIKYVWSLN
ncbi:M56 family metallopeptidase [Pseudoduganella danionis]|uniref:TonB family protein n=1 Tax=Pseudoduganella danionis TaxID=1890295 RepID=A0ABW9SYW1_9BURK|nr:M56 family metallopeptidase [Pseudoduganella danionis]MTW35444.1 TonB family protein [Pseudoduganella danionis]